MTWFKVDDGFYSHVKVLSIPRARRAAALGTWTLAGTWAADKRTDGKVPAHMVEELGGSLDGADVLVEVRLWRKVRGGYQFVNWEQWQPTRAQQEGRTEAERVRKAEQRERARRKPKPSPPDGPPTTATDPTEPDPVPDVSADVPVGQVRTSGALPPLPSRPDPSRDSYGDSGLSSHVPDRESCPQDGRRELDLESVQAALERHCGRTATTWVAIHLASIVLGRAPAPVASKTRYVVRAIETEPFVWQQFVDEHPEVQDVLA